MKGVAFVFVLLVSFALHRRGSAIHKHFFGRGNFPVGYFAGGEYKLDCSTLASHLESPAAEKLRFCEDATLWDVLDSKGDIEDRLLIATCDSGRKQWNTVMGPLINPEPHGTLWLYAPNEARLGPKSRSTSSIPVEVRGKPRQITFSSYPPRHDFHPLGVAIWPSHGGNSSNLYIVNHARQKSVIEHFRLDPHKPTEANYVRTITSPLFIAPNSLTLTSPNSFYVTNDHLMTRRLPFVGNLLSGTETIFALPLGSLLHVNMYPDQLLQGPSPSTHISDTNIVKAFIPFANGVALSPSGNEVAVASTPGEVFIYTRNLTTNALKQKERIKMPFAPDNLHYEAPKEGQKARLIVAGHPDVIGLVKVAANLTGASAQSWVMAASRLDESDRSEPTGFTVRPTGWKLETLFQSEGLEDKGGFGTSTTGLVDPDTGTLYVPGLYAEGGIMLCRSNSDRSN
ncbi:arylesterase [Crepidotus variabilis]|uniref:Arylesterase n=1 Tax=Crepidotus variabilis TaxID=179855 RepID=A0A9P6E9B2_9AGAR|nr:arylesterase [Crepidotus variabilis]